MQSPNFAQGTQTIQAPESQMVSGIVMDEPPFFIILSWKRRIKSRMINKIANSRRANKYLVVTCLKTSLTLCCPPHRALSFCPVYLRSYPKTLERHTESINRFPLKNFRKPFPSQKTEIKIGSSYSQDMTKLAMSRNRQMLDKGSRNLQNGWYTVSAWYETLNYWITEA